MHFASMSLGILDFLIEWLTTFLIWLVGWVFDLIFLLFADLFFSVGTCLLEIVDMVQLIFRKFCGMDTYWISNGSTSVKYEGVDPLMALMTNDDVVQILITLTLVSVVMVIVAAIIKIIQTEFSTEGSKNSKGAIFGQALKSLMLFLIVPVCCIGGVGISNALLKTIDRATNISNGNATLGSSIFASAASSANRVRSGSNLSDPLRKAVGIAGEITDNNREDCADLVDKAFKDNTIGAAALIAGVSNGIITGATEGLLGFLNPLASINGAATALGSVIMPGQYYYQSNGVVGLYYNIAEINFFTYIGAALLAALTMLNASFGLIMRLFKGIILFMISPPMVALMPLDGGSAFKSWRKNFLSEVLMGYSTIVGMNLLFIILPVVDNIKLFQPLSIGAGGIGAGNDFNGINSFVSILVTLTGLFMLKDVQKMIADMIGAGDAAGAGEGMAKKVGGTVAKIGMTAAGAAVGIGAAMKGASLTKQAGSLSKQLMTGKNADGSVMTTAQRAAAEQKLADIGGQIRKNEKFKEFGRKGVGVATGDLLKGADAYLGGQLGGTLGIKTGDARYKDQQAKIKAEDEARAKRKEAGTLTTQDRAMEALLDDPLSDLSMERTGGIAAVEKGIETSQAHTAHRKAEQTTRKATSVEYNGLSAADVNNSIAQIFADLTAGKNGEADAGISKLLEALDKISDKTEEQKDLIQKLTNLQGKVTSAAGAGDATAIDAATKALGIDHLGVGVSGRRVETQAQSMLQVLSSPSFNITSIVEAKDQTAEINRQLNAMAATIRATTGHAVTNAELKRMEQAIMENLKKHEGQLAKMAEEKAKK